MIHPVAQFFARLEERRPFFFNIHRLAGARIASNPGRSVFDRKRAKSPQFHAISARKRIRDFVENNRHDALYIAVKEIWIFVGELLHQFRFDHDRPIAPLSRPSVIFRVTPTTEKILIFEAVTLAKEPCGVKALLGCLADR